MGASNALVATLLTMAGQRNILTIPRAFVHFTKSIESAMLLNQLLYWMPRGHDDGSIYKSDKEWQEELCLSRYAVRQARERLEAMGFLTTELHRVKGAPTMHYFLDYEALIDCWTEWLKTDARLSENEQSDYSKSDNRMSENEQSDRPNPDNVIVRKRTIIKEHEIPTKTPAKTPPPAPDQVSGGGGGGGGERADMPKTGHAAEPRHIAYLLSKNMEAAHLFVHLDPEAAIQDFDNRVADGYPIGAIVDRWKRTPPHPGAIYERRPSAPNRPRRSAAAPAAEPLDPAAIRAKIKPVTIDDW